MSNVYSDVLKVYGPYKRNDGREHVVLYYGVDSTPNKKTVSYPKYLMELHLNRYLTADETVDHIDKNPLNNITTNLQVLPRSEHAKLDTKRLVSQDFICPQCNITFTISSSKLRNAKHNNLKGKAGPFCSKSFAGIYSRKLQLHQISKAQIANAINVQYTSLKEQQYGKPTD